LAFALHRPLDLLEDSLEPAVFLLAMLSLALTRRRWGNGHVVLIAVVLATVLPYIPLLVDPRYILPAAFAYLIWIAVGAELLAERLVASYPSARARALQRYDRRGVRRAGRPV
jgi:cobalamin biosynthesis protein CobD/CbiB